jgi:hypothetical protein
VGRVLQLTPGYALSLSRIRPPLDARERRAIRDELQRLTADPLPGAEDYEALLSPPAVGAAMARQVLGFELWILYVLDGPHVSLRELAARRPVRVGD